MRKSIEAISAAADQLGLLVKAHHESNNLISISSGPKKIVCVNGCLPINSQVDVVLSLDKDYFYRLYNELIAMPKTRSYFDPQLGDYHRANEDSLIKIANDINSHFDYPVIIKSNSGSMGINVYEADSKKEVAKKISQIFSMNSKNYDYVCLAQEKLNIVKEYRAIFYDKSLVLLYEKFGGDRKDNISPLHQEGSYVELVTSVIITNEVYELTKALFSELEIRFCGLDIALTPAGYFLIECNSNPAFDLFSESCGIAPLVTFYKKILNDIFL